MKKLSKKQLVNEFIKTLGGKAYLKKTMNFSNGDDKFFHFNETISKDTEVIVKSATDGQFISITHHQNGKIITKKDKENMVYIMQQSANNIDWQTRSWWLVNKSDIEYR